jgi:hypothetical protein
MYECLYGAKRIDSFNIFFSIFLQTGVSTLILNTEAGLKGDDMKKMIASVLTMSFAFFVFSCGPEDGSPAAAAAAIVEIKASSTLAHKDNKYALIHLVDGNPDTSWVEGVEGDGVGEKVTIILSNKARLKRFRIRNGYWEEKYWSMNNRVRDLMLVGDNGISFTQTLEDIPDEQAIILPEEWETGEITFIIQSVYPGSKWQDTAITEITIDEVKKSSPALIVDTSPQAGRDTAEADSSESGDEVEKDVQAAAGEESFPLEVWAEGFTFTLYKDGKVSAEGYGMAQCDMEFVEGTWEYTEDGKKLISYLVLQQQDCFDMEGELDNPDWKEVSLQTLID